MPSSSGNTIQGSAGTGPSSTGGGSSLPRAPPGIPKDVLAAVGRVAASDAVIGRSMDGATQVSDEIQKLRSSGDSDADSKIDKLLADHERSANTEMAKLKSQGGSGAQGSGAQGSDKSSGA